MKLERVPRSRVTHRKITLTLVTARYASAPVTNVLICGRVSARRSQPEFDETSRCPNVVKAYLHAGIRACNNNYSLMFP